MRQRLIAAFDSFHDVRRLSDADAAQLLRAQEIDIAVDLMGYTQDGRLGILAHRPAPVQANYLGYPGTAGTALFDYLITDGTVAPEAARGAFAEKIVALPHSYQANDDKRVIAGQTPSRAELGLHGGAFVFCCFNNIYKLTPEVFASWVRILARAENSVLWLIEDNEQAAARFAGGGGGARD